MRHLTEQDEKNIEKLIHNAEIIEMVAKDFAKTMIEEGFETFSEMMKCYWWNSKDIMEEVNGIFDENQTMAYVDIEDKMVFYDTFSSEGIPFKDFMKNVRSEIKEIMKGQD